MPRPTTATLPPAERERLRALNAERQRRRRASGRKVEVVLRDDDIARLAATREALGAGSDADTLIACLRRVARVL